MAAGRKTGGRQKGTPNKRTEALAEALEEHGCDPVAALVRIAQDAETPRELRARILSDLLPYLYPRRKAIELEGNRRPVVILSGFVRPEHVPKDVNGPMPNKDS
nr:hypothetical protein [uncultured bacterium]BAH90129.1 hypothetical protein [uncultured bacterium]